MNHHTGSVTEDDKEVTVMMGIMKKLTGCAILLTAAGLVAAGCATQTGQPAKSFEDNFYFVPRVHVEDNSFGVTGGGDYWGCSYDQLYEGYWCPK